MNQLLCSGLFLGGLGRDLDSAHHQPQCLATLPLIRFRQRLRRRSVRSYSRRFLNRRSFLRGCLLDGLLRVIRCLFNQILHFNYRRHQLALFL